MKPLSVLKNIARLITGSVLPPGCDVDLVAIKSYLTAEGAEVIREFFKPGRIR